MSSEVDLSQLAVDREPESSGFPRARRPLLTRYVVPSTLLVGFLALGAWAVVDLVFPRRPVTVIPVLATRSDVRQEGTPLFRSAGWVEPRPTATRVAALAGGVVERLLVVEDQVVKAGQPVAELVREDAQLAYELALADFELGQAEAQEADAVLTAAVGRLERPVHLEAVLAEAEAALAQVETQQNRLPFEVRRAEAQLEVARRNYEGKTAAPDAVSQRAVEQARSELASATASLEEIEDRKASLAKEREALAARRDALKTQLERKVDEILQKREAESRLQAAQARLKQAEVHVAEAKLRLDRMTVRAPVAGRILHLVAQPGSRLMEGRGHTDAHDASTVVTMYQPDSLQVRVDVRLEDISRVTLGQAVRIESPAVTQPLQGQVLSIGSEADVQKNTLEVKVALDRPPSLFRPEMLVDATFLAPHESDRGATVGEELRLYIPHELVGQDDAGPFVWAADQSEQVARKTLIEIERPTGDGLVEVTKGLSLSSRLIASGREGLADGDRIRVTGEDDSLATSSSLRSIEGTESRRNDSFSRDTQ